MAKFRYGQVTIVAKGIPVSLVLDLPAELETELAAEAARLSMPLQEYVLRLLSGWRAPNFPPCTGADVLA
jgi:hypothetical protein